MTLDEMNKSLAHLPAEMIEAIEYQVAQRIDVEIDEVAPDVVRLMLGDMVAINAFAWVAAAPETRTFDLYWQRLAAHAESARQAMVQQTMGAA